MKWRPMGSWPWRHPCITTRPKQPGLRSGVRPRQPRRRGDTTGRSLRKRRHVVRLKFQVQIHNALSLSLSVSPRRAEVVTVDKDLKESLFLYRTTWECRKAGPRSAAPIHSDLQIDFWGVFTQPVDTGRWTWRGEDCRKTSSPFRKHFLKRRVRDDTHFTD